ncbi:MAG: hypothetical protein ACRDZ3_03190 [Acidimicrobiia bacterium]
MRTMVPSPELEAAPWRARVLAIVVLLAVALAGVVTRPAQAAAEADVVVDNYKFGPDDLKPHSFSYTFNNPGRYPYYCGFLRLSW